MKDFECRIKSYTEDGGRSGRRRATPLHYMGGGARVGRSLANAGNTDAVPPRGNGATLRLLTVDFGAVSGVDDDHDADAVFESAEDAPVSHTIAPKALEFVPEGFAESTGIRGALDPAFQKFLDFLRGGRSELSQFTDSFRRKFIRPAHAKHPPP